MPHTPTLSEPRVRSTAPALHGGTLSCESLRHLSDDRLVALTRAGSERAFSEITGRYQRQLRSYCSRIVGAERAQDAVQQALLQAFLSLRDGAPRQIALRPWLYRIAHNCSIDLLRMTSWDYEQLDLESDGVPQPPALFEQKEELRGLVAGMRRLPDAQRRALTLRELEGCSYEEISARLGHTGSGVRQLIFRARTTLRKGAGAVLLPFGLLRDRLLGLAPALETHQVAGVAAVPASSGGGIETVGAAALAMVAVLGGVAGGVRAGQERRAPEPRPAHVANPSELVPAGRVFAAPMLPRTSAPRSRQKPAGHGGADADAEVRVVQPNAPAADAPAAPLVAEQEPAEPAAVTPEAPLPSAPADPAEEPTTVGQQTLAATPPEGPPATDTAAPAPEQTQITPSPPAAGTTGLAGPQARTPVSRQPAKPPPPGKPRPSAAPPPAAGPKPAAPTARPKRSGRARVPAGTRR